MKIIMKVLCLLKVVGLCAQELWQTIQAHNHNADLLKHHKEIETNSVAACLESTVESLTMVLEVPTTWRILHSTLNGFTMVIKCNKGSAMFP